MNNQVIKSSGLPLANLSVVDSKALETLVPAERKIIELALLPKITEGNPVSVTTEMIAIITTAFTRAGQKLPDDNGVTLALYADEFYSTLIEEFPRVTIGEVKEALKAGVYGKAGKYYGLNPVTFLQFVEHYLFTQERKEAKKKFDEKSLLISYQREEMTPAQKEEDNKAFVNYLYSDFLKGKLLVDYVPTFVYSFLNEKGEIILPIKDQHEAIEKAAKYLTRLKHSNKLTGSRETVQDHFNYLDPDQSVINAAMQFAVIEYFENCKLAGKTTIFQQPKLLK